MAGWMVIACRLSCHAYRAHAHKFIQQRSVGGRYTKRYDNAHTTNVFFSMSFRSVCLANRHKGTPCRAVFSCMLLCLRRWARCATASTYNRSMPCCCVFCSPGISRALLYNTTGENVCTPVGKSKGKLNKKRGILNVYFEKCYLDSWCWCPHICVNKNIQCAQPTDCSILFANSYGVGSEEYSRLLCFARSVLRWWVSGSMSEPYMDRGKCRAKGLKHVHCARIEEIWEECGLNAEEHRRLVAKLC